jgi:heme/copper-type cytochrome/quinol oxidase subunit 2
MKERLHEQISTELRQISRNDTTVLVIALVVTVIFFGLAFGFGANAIDRQYGSIAGMRIDSVSVFASFIMFVSLAVIIAINWFSIVTINKNKAQKIKLAESLTKLYQEENLGGYAEGLSRNTFETRRNIYIAVLSIIMGASVLIPLASYIIRIAQMQS